MRHGRGSRPKDGTPIPAATTEQYITVATAITTGRLHALVVVGGYTTQNISVNDVYFLLLEDWTWKEYRSMESFPKRHHFSLVEIGSDEMILFGGVSRPAETLLADTWKVCLGGCRFTQDHAPKGLVIT